MEMNLNIGSSVARGEYKRKRHWVNFDINKCRGVNVLGDALVLPFKNNSFYIIHCVHMLEHVTREKYVTILSEAFRVLKPKGFAYFEVPDFEETVAQLHKAFIDKDRHKAHKLTTSVYGKNEREGMAHYWGFTEYLLKTTMERIGYKCERMIGKDNMISPHYSQEPVLLIRGKK